MDILSIDTKCLRGDSSPEAIHKRLVATRLMTGLSQKELAEQAGLKYTTYRSQEAAGAPSIRLMRYFLSSYHVDFNFILGGDHSRIPRDALDGILANLD